MALTNSERQKRWREKHRALFNLRRRQARNVKSIFRVEQRLKRLLELRGGAEEAEVESSPREMDGDDRRSKFEELKRELEKPEQKVVETSEEASGVVEAIRPAHIPLRQWNETQRRKREAKEGGYEYDEYSQ